MTVFSKCFASFLLCSLIVLSTMAQAPSSADPNASGGTAAPSNPPAQEPAAPAPATWSVGPIDFSGLVDGYYSFNSNHPASQVNQLYNFNDKTNQFSLNMAKLSLSHSPDPVGFQVDLGFGRAFEIFNRQPSERGSDTFRFLEQAYLSLKPAKAKGLEVDFGKFVTSAGAEVIETNGNWNYSRSLLFALAIPYYHFGVRASVPVGKYFTGGVQIVNGWNNIGDNNSGKTIGVTGAITTKKFTWSNNYYAGPENNDTSKGWRHLYDTTFLFTPSTKLGGYINFDYGQNRNFSLISGVAVPGVPLLSKWYGVAGALHLQPNSFWSFTPRVEWFKDRDGFATGVAQDLKEFTLTGEYKMVEGFLARLEYRHDWANQPFFDYGGVPGSKKDQNTVTLGVLAYFGPKR
jgi:Putative beta-barrel porin-2, OmpL-like. bbp2